MKKFRIACLDTAAGQREGITENSLKILEAYAQDGWYPVAGYSQEGKPYMILCREENPSRSAASSQQILQRLRSVGLHTLAERYSAADWYSAVDGLRLLEDLIWSAEFRNIQTDVLSVKILAVVEDALQLLETMR